MNRIPEFIEPATVEVEESQMVGQLGKICVTFSTENDSWCFFLPKTSQTIDVAVGIAAHSFPRPPTDGFKRYIKEKLGFDVDDGAASEGDALCVSPQ